MKEKINSIILFVFIAVSACSNDTSKEQDANLRIYKVLPQDTDSGMTLTNKPHYAMIDTRVEQNGKLLVFIGGTNSAPSQYQNFSKEAAALGYKVLDINYLNTITTLACKDEDDVDCFVKFHEEIIFGIDQSNLIDVNVSNSIVNRILKLLQFLNQAHPAEGWDQFYTAGDLNYLKFVLAGHSQGGGHAAYLTYKFEVDRLIVFSSPNDYSEKYSATATWCNEVFATSTNRFYGLMHKRDDVVPPTEQYAVWKDMGLLNDADTSSADKTTYTNFHALYTNYEADAASNSHALHNVPVMDNAMPTGSNFIHLKEVWRYLLGN